VLVPVPGSAPVQRPDWVGARVAWCLREMGLAAEVWPLLRRREAVKKSAFATAGGRPSVLEHYASFTVGRAPSSGVSVSAANPLRLTLVDDVITRGRTLLAAASRLREAFPSADICAFALLRTLNRDEMLHQVLDPCEGEIQWVWGDARRSP